MDDTKLELTDKSANNENSATYKPIPERDVEEQAVQRPKSLHKSKEAVNDGADEKMLPNKSEITISPKNGPKEKQNGDAKLDIEGEVKAFVGMSKDELMKYANDPFWVRLRWVLFIAFWLLWALMLLGAIVIIYAAPKCSPPPPKTWWEQGPLTEITADATMDELKALNERGIKGFIVTYAEDAYKTIDNQTNKLIPLLKQAKAAGLNVIVDLEAGTSSVWLDESHTEPKYKDYYIWKEPKRSSDGLPNPPNNWKSLSNGTAWSYSSERQEYYYTPNRMALLNFRNENVTEAFSSVIKNWIDYGANGIRLRKASYLLVDPKFEDEEPSHQSSATTLTDYNFYLHTKTQNLFDLGLLLSKWRKVVKNNTENGPFMVNERLLKTESYKLNGSLVVDLALESHLFKKSVIVPDDAVKLLNYTLNISSIEWPLWKVNTHALPVDVLDIVTFLLPGTPLVEQNATINPSLLKIRETPSIMRGSCSFHNITNNTVLAFVRVSPGNPGILVIVNPTANRMVVDIPKEIPQLDHLEEVTPQFYSKNYNETIMENVKIGARNVPIPGKSAIVLSYVPKAKDE